MWVNNNWYFDKSNTAQTASLKSKIQAGVCLKADFVVCFLNFCNFFSQLKRL